MAQIFNQLVQNKQAIVDAVMKVIQSVPDEHDYARDALRIEEDLSSLHAKKDRLLEMSMAEAITIEEFKRRNDGFNEQIKNLEQQLEVLRIEEQKSRRSVEQLGQIRTALEQELSFRSGIDSELVTTSLDHIVVKKGSTKEELHLDIHLKFGDPYGDVFDREKSSFRFNCPRRDKAQGSFFWQATGETRFDNYNRRTGHCVDGIDVKGCGQARWSICSPSDLFK